MICVPPFRGEFGLKLRYHVPAVRALPRPLVVCIEPGEEALYPDAKHITVKPRPDEKRRGRYLHDIAFVSSWIENLQHMYPGCTIVTPDRFDEVQNLRLFSPKPYLSQELPLADVVVCPRFRKYGVNKNWPEWRNLANRFRSKGLSVVSAGNRDASDTSVPGENTWRYHRATDATIEAMQKCRVVVATSSGLSLLALLVGKPLVLIAHEKNLVAPGPVLDEKGKELAPAHPPIRLDDYYHPLNHKNVPIVVVENGWTDLDAVIQKTTELL